MSKQRRGGGDWSADKTASQKEAWLGEEKGRLASGQDGEPTGELGQVNGQYDVSFPSPPPPSPLSGAAAGPHAPQQSGPTAALPAGLHRHQRGKPLRVSSCTQAGAGASSSPSTHSCLPALVLRPPPPPARTVPARSSSPPRDPLFPLVLLHLPSIASTTNPPLSLPRHGEQPGMYPSTSYATALSLLPVAGCADARRPACGLGLGRAGRLQHPDSVRAGEGNEGQFWLPSTSRQRKDGVGGGYCGGELRGGSTGPVLTYNFPLYPGCLQYPDRARAGSVRFLWRNLYIS